MTNTESVDSPQDGTSSDDVGARLKALRKMYGLSQRQLAKRAGVTNATISLIEQGRVSPSIGSLQKVLGGIPMPLAEFFSLQFAGDSQIFFRAGEMPNVGAGAIEVRLLGGVNGERDMALCYTVYPAGQGTGPELISGVGEEGGIVVAGRLEVTVGSEVAVLGPGDGYYFSSRRPHRFRNPDDADCIVVSAITPPPAPFPQM
ncbi:cupin domain-containing protein [Microbulbifer magnicolonia]|uniref:cupin domain-containing protein n=1 Tax=Microbulbifer magnicolonia TaxID=3109744 RepID=UPI002B40F5B6|nr:cupin domain-containing protein [Microbulbifer sp. GG15]